MIGIEGLLLVTIGMIIGVYITLMVVDFEEWIDRGKSSIPKHKLKKAIKAMRRKG